MRKFQTVQTEGNRQVSRLVAPYRLEANLSVEYRVRSQRGVQFRRWEKTRHLQEHPCHCDAILPKDSRPLPIVDETSASRKYLFCDLACNICEPKLTTCIGIGQRFVIQT
ncbi:MAG: RhuM family protein [Pirellula sp.]